MSAISWSPPAGLILVIAMALLILQSGDVSLARGNSAQEAFEAIQRGDLEALRSIIDAGLDINCRDSNGNETLLHVAVWKQNFDIVSYLVKHDADIEARDRAGGTPLHSAHWDGAEKVAKLLLDNGANINTIDEKGWTPLHWACWNGQTKMVEFFVRNGASINTKDRNGQTPASSAAAGGYSEILTILRNASREESTGNNTKRCYYFLHEECGALISGGYRYVHVFAITTVNSKTNTCSGIEQAVEQAFYKFLEKKRIEYCNTRDITTDALEVPTYEIAREMLAKKVKKYKDTSKCIDLGEVDLGL